MPNDDDAIEVRILPPERFSQHERAMELLTQLRIQLWRPMTSAEVDKLLDGLWAVSVDLYETIDLVLAQGITDATPEEQAALFDRLTEVSGQFEDASDALTLAMTDIPGHGERVDSRIIPVDQQQDDGEADD